MGTIRYLFCRRVLCGNRAFYGQATGLEPGGQSFTVCRSGPFFDLFRATHLGYFSYKGLTLGNPMRALKGVLPVAGSIGLIMAFTAVLWLLKLANGGHHLVYIYLFPITLIAA